MFSCIKPLSFYFEDLKTTLLRNYYSFIAITHTGFSTTVISLLCIYLVQYVQGQLTKSSSLSQWSINTAAGISSQVVFSTSLSVLPGRCVPLCQLPVPGYASLQARREGDDSRDST